MKGNAMLHKQSFLKLSLILLMTLYTGTLSAQDLRSTLFGETEKLMQQANKLNAEILSPENYELAMEKYLGAESDYKAGDDLQDIRDKLKSAIDYFLKAIETGRLAEVTFPTVVAARNDALESKAPEFSLELWKEAEEKFNEAARQLENGDVTDAKVYGGEAESFFRKAELEAIQTYLLAETRSLLIDAENKYVEDNAPITLQKAKDLVLMTEIELKKDRYDTDEARSLVHQAKYEALHSLYLSELITDLIDNDKTFEDLILLSEEPIQRIAGQLDMNAEFDKGYDKASEQIINEIKLLQDSLSKESQNLVVTQQELQLLQEQLSGIEIEKSALSEKMEALERVKQQFSEVQKLFYPPEAMVFRDENNIFLRLVGLNFDVGKSDLNPEFYGLLGKVQNAITIFPDCKITIEGHTDSQGGDETNQKLSQERANAVMYYLLANMNIEMTRVKAIGYGETKPIANNETSEGRKKNRRIDVIIHPTGL